MFTSDNGVDAGAQMAGTFALNIDLAPTIAEAARITYPPTDGRSLLPVLAGDRAWRSDFLVEHLEGTNPIPTYCAVRSERWMYVSYTTGEEELYDLETDPYEVESSPATLPAEACSTTGARACAISAPPLHPATPTGRRPASRSRSACWAPS